MFGFLIRRISQGAVVLFAATALIFAGVFAIGNPIDILISPRADQIERENAIRALGLDRPFHEQYAKFLGNLAQGDFGRSFVYNEGALDVVLRRLPATLELAFCAMALAILIGVPLGLWAGLRRDTPSGRIIMAGSILGFSLPSFWQGLMLIVIFSVGLGWLPAGGRGEVGDFLGLRSSLFTWDGLGHLILPAFNLALFKISLIIRMVRAGVIETGGLDYIRFARAKGLSEPRIVFVHILKVISVPLVTVLGMEFGSVIAFAVVTETIFDWPGIGKLIIDSIFTLDRPVIVAHLMIIIALFLLINLVVDLLYALLDPRIAVARRTAG